ncbi:MAG: hypothetical protein JWP06_1125 [Candidatus Saccharibacteria bacterium]|nr:hypothetical protein [Candidatus Saccharibacteria bacterium]
MSDYTPGGCGIIKVENKHVINPGGAINHLFTWPFHARERRYGIAVYGAFFTCNFLTMRVMADEIIQDIRPESI